MHFHASGPLFFEGQVRASARCACVFLLRHQKEPIVLLAGSRAAAACGHSGALCFSRLNAAWELAALKHPTPVSLIRCDARHALRLGQVERKLTATATATATAAMAMF